MECLEFCHWANATVMIHDSGYTEARRAQFPQPVAHSNPTYYSTGGFESGSSALYG